MQFPLRALLNSYQAFLFCYLPCRLGRSCLFSSSDPRCGDNDLNHAHRRRGLKGRPAWAMFTATAVSFIITTVDLAAQLAVFALFIRGPLMVHFDLSPYDQDVQTNKDIFVPDVIIEWTTILLVRSTFLSCVFILNNLASADFE